MQNNTIHTYKFYIKNVFLFPLLFSLLVFLVYVLGEITTLNFKGFGVIPLKTKGIIGIAFAPIIHKDLSHLLANFPGLIIGLCFVFYYFHKVRYVLFHTLYFVPGIITWFIGREASHIGASGIIYGLMFFILAYGLFSKKIKFLIFSALIILFYGSMIWGIFPHKEGVSWEYHLGGALMGILMAYYYKNRKNLKYQKKKPTPVNNLNTTFGNSDFIYEYKKRAD